MKEDRRTVLRAVVRTLTVQLRGVMVLPENLQQVVIFHLRRIVFHFDGFGVTSAIAANIFVRGVLELSARVADCVDMANRVCSRFAMQTVTRRA